MIEKIAQTVEPLWLGKRIVYKTFKRNNQTINCKTFYFSDKDFYRKWTITEEKPIKEISLFYENNVPLEGSIQTFNFIV